MTDGLVEFLRDRLDEDEQIAQSASGGTVIGSQGAWSPSPAGDEWEACRSEEGDEELLVALRLRLPRPPDVMSGYWGAVFSARDDDTDPDAWSPMPRFEHAARHDPARVLADVEAKRRIIELHEPGVHEYVDDGEVCMACGYNARYPCNTLRLLTLPFREHSAYRPEWAPDA